MVPLREGGSLPAILETEGGDYYVVKFRGAGQGARALIAELIVGGIARRIGLPVPEIALVGIDESFGRSEPDPEIQDILKGSRGTNVGLRYLPSALTFDPVAVADVDPELAAEVVWLDAFTTNIDRSPRNPNMLVWESGIWLIDHGAALYFHHNWAGADADRRRAPFAGVKDHVLLPFSGDIVAADERIAERFDAGVLEGILAAVPDDLLMDAPTGTVPAFETPEVARAAYLEYLGGRFAEREALVRDAARIQAEARAEKPTPLGYRR